jgi:hypothetical protein
VANATPSANSERWCAGIRRARHQPGGQQADADPEGEAEQHVLQDEVPPHEPRALRQGRGEGQHGRERQAVVEARLEVQGVADHAGHARVGHHRGRQHRVGRREQRADQQRRRPVEPDQQLRRRRHDHRGQRHRDDELAQRQPPGGLQHLGLDLEPVAEQDHDQGHGGEVVHEGRARVDVEHAEPALAEHEPGDDEHRGQGEERAMGQAGGQRADDEEAAEDQGRDVEVRGGHERHAR